MNSNFLVIGRGRSGSHLLMSLIGSHPQIFAEKGEVFFHKSGPPIKRFSHVIPAKLMGLSKNLRGALRSNNAVQADIKTLTDYIDDRANSSFKEHDEIKSYGFNFFTSQLESPYITSPIVKVEDFLENLNGYKVIHLYRKHVVRQALSIMIKLVKEYKESMSQGNKITVDMNKLQWLVKQLYSDLERQNEVVSKYNHLKICYEEDLLAPNSHQITADKVFKHLGFDSYHISTDQRRNSSVELESYIENADEVKALIAKHCSELEDKYYKV